MLVSRQYENLSQAMCQRTSLWSHGPDFQRFPYLPYAG
jgi:hypothetical protein